jgi:hypothetical protein
MSLVKKSCSHLCLPVGSRPAGHAHRSALAGAVAPQLARGSLGRERGHGLFQGRGRDLAL